jgi:hypothetical protein
MSNVTTSMFTNAIHEVILEIQMFSDVTTVCFKDLDRGSRTSGLQALCGPPGAFVRLALISKTYTMLIGGLFIRCMACGIFYRLNCGPRAKFCF